MFWLIFHNCCDFDSNSDRIIQYIHFLPVLGYECVHDILILNLILFLARSPKVLSDAM